MMLEEDSLWSPRDTEVLQTMKSGISPSGRWAIGFAQQCTIALTNNEMLSMYLHTVHHRIWRPKYFTNNWQNGEAEIFANESITQC